MKIIAVSGASFSGKTTFMEKVKEVFPQTITVTECIRERNINISELRSDSKKYFIFQKEVIREKIKTEKDIIKFLVDSSNVRRKYCLIDRSLIDSMFYLTFYCDKNSMTQEDMKEYSEFWNEVFISAKYAIDNIYDKIFLFKPIKFENNENDLFRDNRLKQSQEVEWNMIRMMTYGLCPINKIVELSVEKIDNPIEWLLNQ